MSNGQKRDTPLINLAPIPDDPSEDEYDDEDSFYSLDDEEIMLGGGDVSGAEKVSQKLKSSFFKDIRTISKIIAIIMQRILLSLLFTKGSRVPSSQSNSKIKNFTFFFSNTFYRNVFRC